MISKTFGTWIVISLQESDKPVKRYLCLCSCGNKEVKVGAELKRGRGTTCSSCNPKRKSNDTSEIGKNYGDWTILEIAKSGKSGKSIFRLFKCKCKCESIEIVRADSLRNGRSSRCMNCNLKRRWILDNGAGSRTRTYNTWKGMLLRCNYKAHKSFHNYGGRGITVCERWLEFKNFFQDMGEKPENLELDRIDNNGNYEPGNCRWVTRKENLNNTRINKKKI